MDNGRVVDMKGCKEYVEYIIRKVKVQFNTLLDCPLQFKGDYCPEKTKHFVNYVKAYKKIKNISDANAFDDLPFLLSGGANIWWNNHHHDIHTWEDAIEKLQSQFSQQRPAYQIYMEIFDKAYKLDETLESFIYGKVELFTQLPKPQLNELTQLDMIYGLLPISVRNEIDRYQVHSITELIERAQMIFGINAEIVNIDAECYNVNETDFNKNLKRKRKEQIDDAADVNGGDLPIIKVRRTIDLMPGIIIQNGNIANNADPDDSELEQYNNAAIHDNRQLMNNTNNNNANNNGHNENNNHCQLHSSAAVAAATAAVAASVVVPLPPIVANGESAFQVINDDINNYEQNFHNAAEHVGAGQPDNVGNQYDGHDLSARDDMYPHDMQNASDYRYSREACLQQPEPNNNSNISLQHKNQLAESSTSRTYSTEPSSSSSSMTTSKSKSKKKSRTCNCDLDDVNNQNVLECPNRKYHEKMRKRNRRHVSHAANNINSNTINTNINANVDDHANNIEVENVSIEAIEQRPKTPTATVSTSRIDRTTKRRNSSNQSSRRTSTARSPRRFDPDAPNTPKCHQCGAVGYYRSICPTCSPIYYYKPHKRINY